MPCDRRRQHGFVPTVYNCSRRWSISPPQENTWKRDGRYRARPLAKRGDDTHGELTDMVCYVSPTCDPRGSGSAWGGAPRGGHVRGAERAWHELGTGCVCGLLSTTSTPRRPTHPPPPPKSAPQPRGANIFHGALTSKHTSRNSQFNPVQYSFLLAPINMKHGTRVCRPSRSFYHAYESSQVRSPRRHQGLFFLFDLAEGSLALKMIGE